MILDEKIVYCLKGKLGFLSDSEWDGDSFSDNPIYAYQYDKPQTGGRISEKYSCVLVKIITHNNGSHSPLKVTSLTCSKHGVKKIRYKCKCIKCGTSTKNFALHETAIERYNEILKTDCITKTWEYVL
jgi:hypothetical protein